MLSLPLSIHIRQDIKALEAIIDEFDSKHQEAVPSTKICIRRADTIVAKVSPSDKKRFQNAASDVRSGVDALLQ